MTDLVEFLIARLHEERDRELGRLTEGLTKQQAERVKKSASYQQTGFSFAARELGMVMAGTLSRINQPWLAKRARAHADHPDFRPEWVGGDTE